MVSNLNYKSFDAWQYALWNENNIFFLFLDDTDEADERDDALSPFEVFEDIEDIEDRAAKKQKKTKKTKKTKKATTTGDDGDIQGIDDRGDALAHFEASDRGDFNKSYTTGKMVQLGKYYKSGIA